MADQANPKPSVVQVSAVIAAGGIAWMLTWALMWCAMFKIYIDVPQLMAISNILSGIGGALTTILVGRSISQLNQPDPPPNGSVTTATVTSSTSQTPAVQIQTPDIHES